MIICLDGGCGNYESLWTTTSYRGVVGCNTTVRVLQSGVNSGIAAGIVPSPFRIMRSLLERIEYSKNGEIIEDFQVNVPAERYKEAEKSAKMIGMSMFREMPFEGSTKPTSEDPFSAYMNRGWKS